MVLHGSAGLDGITGADGAEDLAVHLGGLFEGLRVAGGLAAIGVEIGGDGLHEGAEDGVAGGPGDGAMEPDVVDEVLLGVVEGGVHLGDLFGELRDVLVGGALGGEGGHVGLQDDAGLEHLPGKEAMESSEDGEGAGIERRGAAGDEGACAVAALEHAHGGEESDSGAEGRAADLELAGELALGREAVAGFDLACADKGAYMLYYLHGEVTMSGCFVLRDFGNPFFQANEDSLP